MESAEISSRQSGRKAFPEAGMNGLLGKYFDAVYVISLDQRPDRRKRLGDEMVELGLANPEEITWIRAVPGSKCWAPGFFAAGAGAWGCLQSHLRILQDAIMDGKDQILVMEDDATFHPKSAEMLELFLKQVPGDWDQIFLGGEHATPPDSIRHRPFVMRGRCVHRTHAFAMKRKILPVVYQHLANYPDYMAGGEWHVDHQLGAAHRQGMWNTYAPSWWIVGQKGGASDIAEKLNPDYWWHSESYSSHLPYIWNPPRIPQTADSEVSAKVHYGNNLLPGTLQDAGLKKCVADDDELCEWLKLIASEAIGMGKLPGIQHPQISMKRVASIWTGAILDIEHVSPTAIRDFPFLGDFRNPGDVKKLCRGLRGSLVQKGHG